MLEKIVLYGCGYLGKKYIEKNGIENISLILDRKIEIGKKENYNGVNVMNPDEYLKTWKKGSDFIVIAIEEWLPIAYYLDSYGLNMWDDYLSTDQVENSYVDFNAFCEIIDRKDIEMLSKITCGRKIAMCYGMCHTIYYKSELSKQKNFAKEYVFVDVPRANFINSKNYMRLYDPQIWSYCDLLICNNLENTVYGDVVSTKSVLNSLSERTRVINVTNAHFYGLFPQGSLYDEKKTDKKLIAEFRWKDKFINKMCAQGLSFEEIYFNIQKDDYLDANMVKKYFEACMDNMVAYEKKCDVKIADFVRDNYRTKLLFYSPRHTSEIILREISRRIMLILECEWDEQSKCEVKSDTHEIPVYSTVINALGINKDVYLNRKFNSGDFYDGKSKLNLKEYVYRYCELYKQSMEKGYFNGKRKHILLLGDSISMGYRELVKNKLDNKFEVIYPPENSRFASFLYGALYIWYQNKILDYSNVDLVVWNSGLWDVSHFFGEECRTSSDDYKRDLTRVYKLINKLCPNARIVFATSTSVIEDRYPKEHKRFNSEIEEYNKIAISTITELGGAILDLYEVTVEWEENAWIDPTHFKADYYEKLADVVVDEINKIMG